MCVIITSNDKKCPLEWLDKAAKKNADGGGIAWINASGAVEFYKSLKVEEIKKIYKEIKPPYILHFRIATQGAVCDKLCHPFPVNAEATLETHGTAKAVLAHNGSSSTWRDECKAAVLRWKLQWPNGPWSDSRAFAWLCHHFGYNFADLLDEKIALMTNKGVKIYGKNWDIEDDIHISNDYFLDKVKVWTGHQGAYDYHERFQGQGSLLEDKKCKNPYCHNGLIYDMTVHDYVDCVVCNPAALLD